MDVPDKLIGLDLFSGIGGITVALAPWVRPVAYCDNDRYVTAVLLSRMADGSIPVAPIWDDATTLKGSMLPPIDIIYGGFPCQDISVAGRGAGLEGKRSGLFFEICRLVDEIRPRFIFLENVPAITVRGLDRVIGEFSALRYDCRWTIVSAAEVGANHTRRRWFCLCRDLAHANCEGLEGQHILKGNSQERREEPDRYVGQSSPIERGWRRDYRIWRDFTDRLWWKVEPPVGRMVNELPYRVDQLKSLGNAVVPLQARTAFKRLMVMENKA